MRARSYGKAIREGIETDLPVYEMARRAGFEAPCCFSRAFKVEVTQTATAFRKAFTKGIF